VRERPSIKKIESEKGASTVHFADGKSLKNVDHIIFGTALGLYHSCQINPSGIIGCQICICISSRRKILPSYLQEQFVYHLKSPNPMETHVVPDGSESDFQSLVIASRFSGAVFSRSSSTA